MIVREGEFKTAVRASVVKFKPMTKTEFELLTGDKIRPNEEDDGYYIIDDLDNSVSWKPKSDFEKLYFGISDQEGINNDDIDNFVNHISIENKSSTLSKYNGDCDGDVVNLNYEYITGQKGSIRFISDSTGDSAKKAHSTVFDKIYNTLSVILVWGSNGISKKNPDSIKI